MLKTLIVGAIAAVVGTKLKKAYDAGKLDPYIDRAKAAASEARNARATMRQPGSAPAASRKARLSPSDSPSKPARAAPWPIDTRAIPEKS